MKNELTNELRIGDIIVFKAEEDWFSKAIAWLTDSDVSHAAMVYEKDTLVEVGARGICLSRIATSAGRGAYVLRFEPNDVVKWNPTPLVSAADKYLTAKIRYDFPGLFLLAYLLIQKKLRPTDRLVSIINSILSYACLALDKYIQSEILHHSERAMVCSQLVYQLYYDCGPDYRIQINKKAAGNKLSSNDLSDTICLMDLQKNEPADFLLNSTGIIFSENTDIKELYEALCASALPHATDTLSDFPGKTSAPSASCHILKAGSPKLQESALLAGCFMNKVERLIAETDPSLPIDALFVTPSDLAYHALNLKTQYSISLTRTQILVSD